MSAAERQLRGKTHTSTDVARRVGVSQSTVSLVLSGKAEGRVSPGTQEAVLRACRELGYRPSVAARTLRLGLTHTVALVVPNVLHPFFAPMFRGATRAARERGYAVVLVDAEDSGDWQQILLDTLNAHALDGFALWSAPGMDFSGLEGKVVLLEAEWPGVPSVHLDVEGGTRAAMEHLFALGHTKIGYLAADPFFEAYRVRRNTYRAALEEAGLPVRSQYEGQAMAEREALTLKGGLAAARGLLSLPEPPTAILCSDDLFAVGAYKAAKEMGLRIPEDLSVVGYDDLELATMVEPELTTVRIPPEEMGAAAIALLLDLLDGEDGKTNDGVPSRIPLSLVVRGSTAPPKGKPA